MARGIIYCMTTVVPGLVKIGKTGIDNFEQRMYNLERNGYNQVVGLKRRFAIELEDYNEKETLIQELFSKSRVEKSELFAVDAELVVQLLSSLEGKQVFPKSITKEEVFSTATDEVQTNIYDGEKSIIPDGEYYIEEKLKKHGTIKATMRVENGRFIVLQGSQCLPCKRDWMPEPRRTAKIENGILMEDVECKSPSTAGWIVLGNANNGWKWWKTQDGEYIDTLRNRE